VTGVTDWRGNRAWSNGNPLQCLGIACAHNAGPLAGMGGGASTLDAAMTDALPAQLEHPPEE
jgi:hypothetical protein